MKSAKNTLIQVILLIVCNYSVAQVNYALVIGIGKYPEGSDWTKINGDNDIRIIRELLLDNGFTGNNIAILMNDSATKTEILKQFKIITDKVKNGDNVYIHFSGHGQQITDTNGDEEDEYDEAWIPYDAEKSYSKGRYEGENHLVDDEINTILTNIKQKIGSAGEIIVIADACHSGDSSRGDDDQIVRGGVEKFELPQKSVNKISKSSINWIMISACKSYQVNYECKIDGVGYGSLSYALYQNRSAIKTENRDNFFDKLSKDISKLISPYFQSPLIEIPHNYNKSYLFAK